MAAAKKNPAVNECSPPWYCDGCGKDTHAKANRDCRCNLRPYNEDCPKEAPSAEKSDVPVNKHHVIPDTWWDITGDSRLGCAPTKEQGPSICVRGHGKAEEHGNIHDDLKRNKNKLLAKLKKEDKNHPGTLSFEQTIDLAARSVVNGMGDPKCSVRDLKRQLRKIGPCGPLNPKRKRRKGKHPKSKKKPAKGVRG